MKVVAMIPARFDSERLPGKLMMDLGGEPVILRTYKNALKSKLFNEVYVVTDSKLIYDCLKENGGQVLMSSAEHISGSDRIAEFSSYISTDIIVNIQGDEPFIDINSLSKLINLFKKDVNSNIDLASLMQKISNVNEIANPNVVKVVVDSNNFALYFSRSPIPYDRSSVNKTYFFKHIGVYAFRKNSLLDFYNSKATPLEKSEKLEQLRYLENGKKIMMIETNYNGLGIDTMDDLINARKII
ncbi:MAG: 3-deoxy-manno-octulosonate cytidylyltransferase [Bacteroidetes bacterium]|jgi:3-deoxy-manno-octulosonate cytidylyltransferase (CMP-KDO synthetase)|nr:3-deoxy-manno-octulosonate cytidylyltransferase [Bacteroidota bacterium]MDA1019524.1 3-deoxy-manno-octulosonate cytidylyltransferase [Bacteroidota bacterium]|tara:strand:- start:15275 stop:16000 length:726 start_codon:yes stop_codon:yes gene_type:complete